MCQCCIALHLDIHDCGSGVCFTLEQLCSSGVLTQRLSFSSGVLHWENHVLVVCHTVAALGQPCGSVALHWDSLVPMASRTGTAIWKWCLKLGQPCVSGIMCWESHVTVVSYTVPDTLQWYHVLGLPCVSAVIILGQAYGSGVLHWNSHVAVVFYTRDSHVAVVFLL